MGRTSRGDNKSKQKRQQAILRLIQENPISRQETLLEYLSKEGFDATQATMHRAWALHRAEIKAGENEHVEQSAN